MPRAAPALLAFACLAAAPVAAQTPATAQQVFESRRPDMLRAAPDEVLDQLRNRIGDLFRGRGLAPSAFQDPFTRRVDTLVEQPWPGLRRRCFAHAPPLSAADALDAADALLAESGFAPPTPPPSGSPRASASADLRGEIAAMLAGLDQRICRCADKPSLALAADCAS